MVNKKAFSFVEIIITISIIALLAVVGFSAMDSSNEKADNAKVVSDIETINNALEALSQENSELPMPGGNKNFFQANTDYAHSYSGTETFGVYGSITEDTIAKKYLDILPLDPRTNSYYSYGKTKEASQFEVAGVQINSGEASAIVTGNYTAENGPYGLIREYNGSNFVYDKSTNNLPYNPEELVLIATDAQGFVYREGDTIKVDNNGEVYKNNTLLHTGTDDLELFFSDGSVSILEKDSELTLNKLSFPKENNLTTFVQLALKTGTVWTRATNLNDESEFEIYTTDSTAAVRGTIFAVTKETNGTDITVVEGVIEVYEENSDGTRVLLKRLLKNDSYKFILNNAPQALTASTVLTIYDTLIKTKFKLNDDITTADEIESLIAVKEINETKKEEEIEKYPCMYNGEEIPESTNTGLYAYKEKISPNCDSSSNRQEIACEKGNIIVDPEYKYTTCNAPGNCGAYTRNGYNQALNVAPGTVVTITKEISYDNAGVVMGMITYTQEIQCNADGQGYTETGTENSSLTCTAPYVDDVPGVSCKIDIPTCSIGDLTGGELHDDKCIIEIDFNSVDLGGIHNITKNIPDENIELKIKYTDRTEETYDDLGDTIKFKTVDRDDEDGNIITNGGLNIYLDETLYLNKSNISEIKIYETDEEGDGDGGAGTPVEISDTGCGGYSTYKIHSGPLHSNCKEYLNNIIDLNGNNVKCAEKQNGPFGGRTDLIWVGYQE